MHWNKFVGKVVDSYFRENLKVGTGVANSSGSSRGDSQVVEAVVIISEMSEQVPSSCIREQDMKTEVCFGLLIEESS